LLRLLKTRLCGGHLRLLRRGQGRAHALLKTRLVYCLLRLPHGL
jgi:hypothetical protein